MPGPVLDSFAVLSFLFKERGHRKIVDVFEKAAEGDETAVIAAPNWGEVGYIARRKVGPERWNEARAALLVLPLQVVAVDQGLAEAAGALKATRKMSLADCFAAALAQQRATAVYTGDPEFKAVAKEIEVVWL